MNIKLIRLGYIKSTYRFALINQTTTMTLFNTTCIALCMVIVAITLVSTIIFPRFFFIYNKFLV